MRRGPWRFPRPLFREVPAKGIEKTVLILAGLALIMDPEQQPAMLSRACSRATCACFIDALFQGVAERATIDGACSGETVDVGGRRSLFQPSMLSPAPKLGATRSMIVALANGPGPVCRGSRARRLSDWVRFGCCNRGERKEGHGRPVVSEQQTSGGEPKAATPDQTG